MKSHKIVPWLTMVFSFTILLGSPKVVWANAPVYDVDDVQQQFATQDTPESGQPDYPLPPPPDQDGTFVPMEREAESGPGPSAAQLSGEPQAPVPPNTLLTMEQRVQRIEQQMNNIQQNDATARMESLQNQMQTLRDQVEQLNHLLSELKKGEKITSELDKNLDQLSTSSNMVVASAKRNNKPAIKPAIKKAPKSEETAESNQQPTHAAADNQPNVAEEQQIYQSAYNLIKSKKYNDAVNVLRNMVEKYPSGQFAANAHYWLGELYGLLGKNLQALSEFSKVVKDYPESPRLADAQLKIGLLYAAEFKWPEAKGALKKVVTRYPGSHSARLASEQLKQIRQAGH